MNAMGATTGKSGRVTVLGTLNVDQVWQVPALPRPGQTIVATAVERQFGGKGANQAVAAARQGAAVRLIGAVGADAEGRAYLEHLTREGIDVSGVAAVASTATGTAHVYVDTCGENLIVVDRGANARVPTQALEAQLDGADVLLVQLECEPAVAIAALRLAAARGLRTLLNASPVPPLFPWGEFTIDTVIVNEHECVECFGLAPDVLVEWPGAKRRDFLAERKLNHVVITQGAEPTLHISGSGVQRVATYPVQPRDTVGAGDTFAGTLAANLARGAGWEGALRNANVAAALSTLALGAQSAMPTQAAVAAALAAHMDRVAS
jgi:ribokinase